MIPASDALKKVLKTSHAIKINAGCLIEYNLNSMVNDIVITGAEYKTINGAKPFQKLLELLYSSFVFHLKHHPYTAS